MKRIKEQAVRGLGAVGKAALLAIAIFAVLALAVATAVLVPVMLAATILPTAVVGLRRPGGARRYAGHVLIDSAARARQGATWRNRTE